jgi:hypothetical protein
MPKNVSTLIFRVFRKLGKKAIKTVEGTADDVSHGISNAYKNTWGKMIIDYGKTVSPINRAYGDLIEEINVNPTCNQTCAITCFKPLTVDDGITANWRLGFKRSCFENTCGCKFNIKSKMNRMLRGHVIHAFRTPPKVKRKLTARSRSSRNL